MAEKKQDIAPDLLNRILTSFGTKLRGNEKLAELADKLQNGTAAYADAYEYALEVGTALSDTFGEELSSDVLPDGKMYFNIANRVVRDPMTRAYRLIADKCEGVQKKLNTAAGIGLKAQRPDYPENRIKGFIDRLSSEPDYDKVSWMLKEPVKTFSESIVDDSVKKNADFHYKAGLSPRIIRSAAAHCCEWCNDVAGTYPYPNVPKDVYRRHNFCRCQVEYDPKTGKRQDVHTRKWSNEAGYGKYRELIEEKREKPYGKVQKNLFGSDMYLPASEGISLDTYRKKKPSNQGDDLLVVNKGYPKEKGRRKNCQRCVTAYELRRRGYDVIAKPANLDSEGHIIYDEAMKHSFDIFEGLSTRLRSAGSYDGMDFINKRLQEYGDGARVQISVVWEKGTSVYRLGDDLIEIQSSHVFIGENINGKIRFIDPQTGNEDCKEYFTKVKNGYTMFSRIDDLPVNEEYLELFVSNRGGKYVSN